jgi:hypothetical protein
MCPASVSANSPSSETERLRAQLRGPWRQGLRAVMVLLSARGLAPAEIAALLECPPPRCGAGSAGSTPRGRPGWPTGRAAAGPGWAGAA